MRENLVGACWQCNCLRGNMPYAEFVCCRLDMIASRGLPEQGEPVLAFGTRNISALSERKEAIKMILSSDARYRDRLPRGSIRFDPVEGASLGSLFPKLAELLSGP